MFMIAVCTEHLSAAPVILEQLIGITSSIFDLLLKMLLLL